MSTMTQLLNNNFGGIRKKDSYFSQEKITCSDCQNVELFYTGLNSGIGVRTSKGNINVSVKYDNNNPDVYTITGGTTNSVVCDSFIKRFTTTLELTKDLKSYLFKRQSDKDIVISEVKYYAWSNPEYTDDFGKQTYYTKTIGDNATNLVPDNEKVIEMFETVQDAKNYLFVYTESAVEGKIYNLDFETSKLELIIGGLKTTGIACGTDYVQGFLDMFVFSNGEDVKYIYSNTETHDHLVVESPENIHLIDTEGRLVKGLGVVVYDDRIWIFNGRVLWYSKKGDCRIFNFTDPEIVTSSGHIEFVKNITAIYPYLGSLAVFHKDSSALIETNPTTAFIVTDESPGGCANSKSLVFHGIDLYFYDDTKKGVFSFKQIVNGDKTLGENVALDVQDFLMDIKYGDVKDIRTLSVVTDDRNEIWFLVPVHEEIGRSIVLIYDYLRGEWVKRKSQTINCMTTFRSEILSGGEQVYQEYAENSFDGEFIESYYICSTFNLGAENTLKITKFPPRLVVDGNIFNNFWVKYVKNYNFFKRPKLKEIKTKTINDILTYDTEEIYDSKYIYIPNKITSIVKMPSATFKALEITFFTTQLGQHFAIKSIEFSKIKVKQV